MHEAMFVVVSVPANGSSVACNVVIWLSFLSFGASIVHMTRNRCSVRKCTTIQLHNKRTRTMIHSSTVFIVYSFHPSDIPHTSPQPLKNVRSQCVNTSKDVESVQLL